MEKSKKTKLLLFTIIVASLGASGYWVYTTYFLPPLGVYTGKYSRVYNTNALKNKVYYCTLSTPKPCDPGWNPVKSNNPENDIRARVAAIGYKAQVLNGTPYGKLDFSPLGQRKAESYAWKLYGDDWRGVNSSDLAVNPKAQPGSPGANRNLSDGYQSDAERSIAMRREKPYNIKYDNGITYQIEYENIYCRTINVPAKNGDGGKSVVQYYSNAFTKVECKANSVAFDLAGNSQMNSGDYSECIHTGVEQKAFFRDGSSAAGYDYIQKPIRVGESKYLACKAAAYFGKI